MRVGISTDRHPHFHRAKWLGITVPIVGDQVQEAVVDT